MLDPNVAQKTLKEITIHFQLAPNLLIQSCYICSILYLHSKLHHSFQKLTPWYNVKGLLEVTKQQYSQKKQQFILLMHFWLVGSIR